MIVPVCYIKGSAIVYLQARWRLELRRSARTVCIAGGTACQGGYLAVRSNFPDAMIHVVGYVYIALPVDSYVDWLVKLGFVTGPVCKSGSASCKGTNRSVGSYLPNPVVIPVGNIDIARGVDRRLPGETKLSVLRISIYISVGSRSGYCTHVSVYGN